MHCQDCVYRRRRRKTGRRTRHASKEGPSSAGSLSTGPYGTSCSRPSWCHRHFFFSATTALPRRRSSAEGTNVAVFVINAKRCEEMGLCCCASCTTTLLGKIKNVSLLVCVYLLPMRLMDYGCAVPLVPLRGEARDLLYFSIIKVVKSQALHSRLSPYLQVTTIKLQLRLCGYMAICSGFFLNHPSPHARKWRGWATNVGTLYYYYMSIYMCTHFNTKSATRNNILCSSLKLHMLHKLHELFFRTS